MSKEILETLNPWGLSHNVEYWIGSEHLQPSFLLCTYEETSTKDKGYTFIGKIKDALIVTDIPFERNGWMLLPQIRGRVIRPQNANGREFAVSQKFLYLDNPRVIKEGIEGIFDRRNWEKLFESNWIFRS